MKTVYEGLKQEMDRAYEEIERDRLPGWKAVFSLPDVLPWMMEAENKVFEAMNDEAEVRFARALKKLKSGWFRINRRVAEEYRKNNPDPTKWELRYVKFMDISYMRCESPSGEFYLTPQPRKPKPGVRAISVAEVEEILAEPFLAKAFECFGGLPAHESEFEPPKKGENHLHFYSGIERPFRTVFSEEDFGGRKSFRRRPFPDDPEGF